MWCIHMPRKNNGTSDDKRPQDESSEKATISRRRYITATGSLGIAGLAGVGTAGALVSKKRVPKYYSGGEVIHWMYVPQAWYEHVQQAKRALEQLNQAAFEQSSVLETGLVRSEDQQYGGWNGFKIEPVIETGKTVRLPSSINGIDISVETRDADAVTPDTDGCYNIGDFSPYPGGVNVYDVSGQDIPCTSGYPVDSGSGKLDIVVAAHCFGDCNVTIGDDAFKETESLGNIDYGDANADIAVIELDSGKYVDKAVREPDGTMRTVKGCASESEIERRASDAFDGHTKIGCTTGETVGGIGKAHISRSSCPSLKGEGFRSEHDAAGGDSGGPHYSIENGDAFMLGHHWGSGNVKDSAYCHKELDVKNTSYGMSCYWLENNSTYVVP